MNDHANIARLHVLLAASLLVAMSADAVASPAPSPRRVVMIAAATEREASFRTLQAVRGQLSDVSATLEVHAVDQLDPSPASQLRSARAVARLKKAAVVFWFHAKRARISIYLHSPGGGRLLERPVQSAGAEGRYEALAVIVRFAVRGLLQGEKIGVRLPPPRPRRVVTPPPSRPPPRARTRPAYRAALEAGYTLDLYSSEVTAAHGLRLAALVNLHRRWSVFLGFTLVAPLDTESEEVALSLRQFPLELGGRFLWRRGRFALGAQLSLSVAVVKALTTPRDLEDNETLQSVPLRAAVAVTPALVIGVRLVRRLTLVLSLGARLYLNRTDYRATPDSPPLLSPWRVQPTATLAIHLPVL